MPLVTATRPIKLDGFVRSCARTIWASVESHGRIGVTPEFLDWLNCQLKKRKLDTIQLKRCKKCRTPYWIMASGRAAFTCDDCEN